MTIRPVGNGDGPRLMPANEGDRLVQMRRVLADAPVRPPQVLAPGRAKRRPGGVAFGDTLLGCAVAAHLAGREVAQPHAQVERSVPRDGAAKADFEVVRMRPEYEQIDRHWLSAYRSQRKPNTSSAGSSWSRQWRSRMRLARYAPSHSGSRRRTQTDGAENCGAGRLTAGRRRFCRTAHPTHRPGECRRCPDRSWRARTSVARCAERSPCRAAAAADGRCRRPR